MTTINYNGRLYDAETVSGYYDSDIIAEMDCYTDDAQEFFDAYIKEDPGFTDLFEYDFYPVD
jgi:hypothetical protein